MLLSVYLFASKMLFYFLAESRSLNIALQNHSLSFELVLLFDFGGGFGVVLTKCFGVGVSCRILYSFVAYLYVRRSGSITSVGEERANLSAVFLLVIMWFLFGEASSSSGCLGWATYFIVALPEPSI